MIQCLEKSILNNNIEDLVRITYYEMLKRYTEKDFQYLLETSE